MQRRIREEITVNLGPAAAWERLRDLSKAHCYVPGVTDTRIDTTNMEGLGASRTVFLRDQPPMQETVIEWNEGSGFVFDLRREGKAIAPFTEAVFSYTMVAAGPHQTRFTLELRYSLGSWFSKMIERVFVRRLVCENVRETARNLKQYYETGRSGPMRSA